MKTHKRLQESLTSLGNGYMGARGSFEERYSADSHLGTYIAGVWFPDKTRVGWWKNGYPKYFGKAINAVNFGKVAIFVDNQGSGFGRKRSERLFGGLGYANRRAAAHIHRVRRAVLPHQILFGGAKKSWR